jgi:hypothetical protein
MANNTADAMSPGVPTRPAEFSACPASRSMDASSVTSTVSASTSGSSR